MIPTNGAKMKEFWEVRVSSSKKKLDDLIWNCPSPLPQWRLGRMITYLHGLLLTKSYFPLITWSCQITWQTKTIISPLLRCLSPPNLTGVWVTINLQALWSRGLERSCEKLHLLYLYYHKATNPQSHTTLWTHGHVRSCDRLKTYLHYHNSYDYQPCYIQ